MGFQLHEPYKPAGDQPFAIQELTEGILRGDKHQVLLGVTGSGKTFTVANVIQHVQKPTLVLTHNKTLVAQLYGEFKQFFPDNAVEYFVSYYDYYQPEAYLPTTDTYIEKDLNILVIGQAGYYCGSIGELYLRYGQSHRLRKRHHSHCQRRYPVKAGLFTCTGQLALQ